MKNIRLTKSSGSELMNWHGGSGRVFLSEGTGNSFKAMDVRFLRKDSGVYLAFGNSKAVKLTPEQEVELGKFAVREVD